MSKITDGTLVPLGLAVVAIGGGAAWLTTMYSAINEARATIQEVKADQREYTRNLEEINKTLGRIEGELQHLRR